MLWVKTGIRVQLTREFLMDMNRDKLIDFLVGLAADKARRDFERQIDEVFGAGDWPEVLDGR